MGQMMGKMDPNATNTMDAQGNVVATGTPGGKVVADPNQGLSGGQLFARKALAGSLRGLGQGLTNAQRPNYQQGASPGMMPMQTPNDFPYPGAQQPRFIPPPPVSPAPKPVTTPDDFPYPGTKQNRVPMQDSDNPPVPPQNQGVPPPDSIYGPPVGVNGKKSPFAKGPNPKSLFYGDFRG